ncbi:MAG: amine oxidase [Actinobacteria bacterium 13_2_20CM_2_71_6]|nr:MAG: amine oxidase [Actinobacteria bacterium 13_2_20CM_2_71_6]
MERWDRNFSELLQELRVAQTGVQVLFAFLLTLPFTNRFEKITGIDRYTYVGTVVAAALATGLLIAPVSYHRLVFRQGRKRQLVQVGSVLATLGLGCLLLAMLGAVFLVMDVVVHSVVAAAIVAVLAAVYVFLWYVLPFLRRRRV